MRLAALGLGLAALGLWLGWLAKGRAAGKTKRIAFRATLLAAIVLLGWVGPDLLARRQIAYGVAVLLCGSLFLAYLYVVRFCPDCGLMQRNLEPAVCARCGAALPRHGMTTVPRRTGHEGRRPGRFLGRSGNGKR
jgi:ribosomal protein L40E